jgi:CubicO group peptidase (beta-lactamase class C family)
VALEGERRHGREARRGAQPDRRNAAPGRLPPRTFAGRHGAPARRRARGQPAGIPRRGHAAAGIPGVALALVERGRVVFEGGLGVRELGKPDPVDAHTRFMIASNTKGMTTLLLAALVDQGSSGGTSR